MADLIPANTYPRQGVSESALSRNVPFVNASLPYLDHPFLSPSAWADLAGRMTLPEKVGQMLRRPPVTAYES